MTFPDPADILNFEVKISPDDGEICCGFDIGYRFQ
jgi:Fe-S oxidoreductase